MGSVEELREKVINLETGRSQVSDNLQELDHKLAKITERCVVSMKVSFFLWFQSSTLSDHPFHRGAGFLRQKKTDQARKLRPSAFSRRSIHTRNLMRSSATRFHRSSSSNSRPDASSKMRGNARKSSNPRWLKSSSHFRSGSPPPFPLISSDDAICLTS